MNTEILLETIEQQINQYVEATETPSLESVVTIGSNTWCHSTPTSVGLRHALSLMVKEDVFEEILVVGDCIDAGTVVDIEQLLKETFADCRVSTETVFGEDPSAKCFFVGENHTITIVKEVPNDFEELDCFGAAIHLQFEDTCIKFEDGPTRTHAQAHLINELLQKQAGGLTVFISNCITGVLQASFGHGDDNVYASTIDVEDLGLESANELCDDVETYRRRWNSLTVPTRNPFEEQYRNQVQEIFNEQRFSPNRTEFAAIQEFGGYMCYDLRLGFPLMTGKFQSLRDIARELQFFNRAETNNNVLNEMGCKVWNGFEAEDGELGPIYGAQWREWQDTRIVDSHDEKQIKFLTEQGYTNQGAIENTNNLVFTRKIDQLSDAINELKSNPNNRRILVTALNPGLSPFDKIRMPVEQRLQQLIEDRIVDTASDYEDEYKAEGYDSSEEMARCIVEEQFGEYENLTHEKLDELNAPDGMIPFKPSDNAEVGQQCLPPCHVMFQLGALPMNLNERISQYALMNMSDKYFAGNPRACSNYGHILVRSHDWVTNDIQENLGADANADQVNAYLTEKGVPDHYLDLAFLQRSADMFYGIPYNAASYSLELMAIASEVGMQPRRVHHYLGNKHVYENQIESMQELMNRPMHTLPEVELKDFDGIENFGQDSFELKYYVHEAKLSAGKVAV